MENSLQCIIFPGVLEWRTCQNFTPWIGHASSRGVNVQSPAWSAPHWSSRFHLKQIMSRVEVFRDANLRSLLRELRTDIAMAVDDPFPIVYGLADKNIITEQQLQVSNRNVCPNFYLEVKFFKNLSMFVDNYIQLFDLDFHGTALSITLICTSVMQCFETHTLEHFVLSRILLRKKGARGFTKPCTPSFRGCWSRADQLSRLSGATYPRTTTWTATPS